MSPELAPPSCGGLANAYVTVPRGSSSVRFFRSRLPPGLECYCTIFSLRPASCPLFSPRARSLFSFFVGELFVGPCCCPSTSFLCMSLSSSTPVFRPLCFYFYALLRKSVSFSSSFQGLFLAHLLVVFLRLGTTCPSFFVVSILVLTPCSPCERDPPGLVHGSLAVAAFNDLCTMMIPWRCFLRSFVFLVQSVFLGLRRISRVSPLASSRLFVFFSSLPPGHYRPLPFRVVRVYTRLGSALSATSSF